jgi:hypothetical protein
MIVGWLAGPASGARAVEPVSPSLFLEGIDVLHKAGRLAFSGDLAPRTVTNLKRRLDRLGYRVILEPNAQVPLNADACTAIFMAAFRTPAKHAA